MQTMADKWDAAYADQECDATSAADVIQQNIHLLPHTGTALDLACGLGGNAIQMAQHGLSVQAWDVSSIALDKVTRYAQKYGLDIVTALRDVESNPPSADNYDVVVVSYFLYRPILLSIRNSLKKGGLLFYQTFTAEKVSHTGPTNPDYLLNRNELLSVCDGMDILVYREEGLQGDVQQGWRNQAMIVAKRLN